MIQANAIISYYYFGKLGESTASLLHSHSVIKAQKLSVFKKSCTEQLQLMIKRIKLANYSVHTPSQ